MKFLSLFSFPTPLCKFFFTVIIIIVIFVVYNGATANKLPVNETVPAVFVFGDSIVDPGNNNHVKTIVKCDFPPYGRDFIGGMPTGRFSNGRVPSDIVAEIFNVKKLLPAYLDPNLQLQDLLTGVSFASGGAGYDPLTAEVVSVLSLSDQLEMFKDVIGKIKATVGENRTEMIVSKSIFIVCIGSDDIANTYYTTPFRKPHYDIPAYTDLMAKSASSFLQSNNTSERGKGSVRPGSKKDRSGEFASNRVCAIPEDTEWRHSKRVSRASQPSSKTFQLQALLSNEFPQQEISGSKACLL
ncbi:SGNH hydrolase-type esterase domain containing protein [Parasponia andersonii]|uniref:SGNH hydrolase-type esterase domain containing protein n=1 Tax=Parasponia andersonii TaxID=3476 RepID=A0A2P5BXF6_PARAD|nr:SGNH hydrolase-type esterase domain containing protein [Parasponia andersonii]